MAQHDSKPKVFNKSISFFLVDSRTIFGLIDQGWMGPSLVWFFEHGAEQHRSLWHLVAHCFFFCHCSALFRIPFYSLAYLLSYSIPTTVFLPLLRFVALHFLTFITPKLGVAISHISPGVQNHIQRRYPLDPLAVYGCFVVVVASVLVRNNFFSWISDLERSHLFLGIIVLFLETVNSIV